MLRNQTVLNRPYHRGRHPPRPFLATNYHPPPAPANKPCGIGGTFGGGSGGGGGDGSAMDLMAQLQRNGATVNLTVVQRGAYENSVLSDLTVAPVAGGIEYVDAAGSDVDARGVVEPRRHALGARIPTVAAGAVAALTALAARAARAATEHAAAPPWPVVGWAHAAPRWVARRPNAVPAAPAE